MQLTFRPATLADVPALARLIRISVQELQPEYTAEQRERAPRHGVWCGYSVDRRRQPTLWPRPARKGSRPSPRAAAGANAKHCLAATIAPGGKTGCSIRRGTRLRFAPSLCIPNGRAGGSAAVCWKVCESAAGRAGFRRLEMGATLAGVPLYRARGYVAGEQREVPLGPGFSLPIIYMVKQLP